MTILAIVGIWALVSLVATYAAVRLVSMNQYED